MAGRVRHPIDVKALEAYVSSHAPKIKVPLDVKQFGFGQSNPTYQLTSPDGTRYVLRKKPPGKLVSNTAHKVEREHRIIAALAGTDVPVPKTYCLCEDDGVVGTAFYIMEFLDGRIIEDPTMPGVSAEERHAMWASAVRTLAALHRVDPDAVGLGNYGRRDGFYARQLQTWRTICAAQARTRDVDTGEPVGDLPHFDAMVDFFGSAANRPRDRATLVHGDYKIDNLVFHKTEPRVIGILDWEMSTIGHPLSDLSNLLMPYFAARLIPEHPQHVAPPYSSSILPTTAHPGFLPEATPGLPSPQELAGLYAASAGWDPREGTQLQWGQAFNVFRSAAICQGIAARQAARQASSAAAKRYAESRGPLAEYAWVLVQEARGGTSKTRGRL